MADLRVPPPPPKKKKSILRAHLPEGGGQVTVAFGHVIDVWRRSPVAERGGRMGLVMHVVDK